MDQMKYPVLKEWIDEVRHWEQPSRGYGVGSLTDGVLTDIIFIGEHWDYLKLKEEKGTDWSRADVAKLAWNSWMDRQSPDAEFKLGYLIGYRFLV